MAEQEERLGQLTAEKNDLENTHPMAAKLLQDGKDGATLFVWFNKMAASNASRPIIILKHVTGRKSV